VKLPRSGPIFPFAAIMLFALLLSIAIAKNPPAPRAEPWPTPEELVQIEARVAEGQAAIRSWPCDPDICGRWILDGLTLKPLR
jgi:hypothetical protein